MPKRVKLNTTLAGPEIGPFQAGTIVLLEDEMASKLIQSGQAVEWGPDQVRAQAKEAVGVAGRPEAAVAPGMVRTEKAGDYGHPGAPGGVLPQKPASTVTATPPGTKVPSTHEPGKK